MTSGEKNGERKSLNVTQILLDFRDDKLQVDKAMRQGKGKAA